MHCLTLKDLKPYTLFCTYMIKNKVFGTQFIKQSPIEHHNLDNYQWYDINEEKNFGIHHLSVKRIYWLQIPKKHNNYEKNSKDTYWTDTLDNYFYAINPNKTYLQIHNNPIFSLKTISVAHALIYLEFYFGPLCLHMKQIQHLCYCMRCTPQYNCPCSSNVRCLIPNCQCYCHRPITHYNSP